MKKRNLFRLMAALMIALVDPRALFGCGPFFPEVIFTHTIHPDFPLDRFARGELGVLQPTYARSYLLVAYRHLNGSGVDSNEEKALVSLWRERLLIDEETRGEKPVDEWLAERGKISGAGKPPEIFPYYTDSGPNHYYVIENCQADAFKTAARTLRDRVKQFGADGAVVVAWAQAQDQVFANCSSGKNIPAPLPADSSPLAAADRAYQIAAANFYTRNFDESARLFGEIAKDGNSPWRQIAPLLIARSFIRKATLSENLDAAALAQAEAQLKRILDDRSLNSAHESARRLLGFVRCRLDPERRIRELARTVTEKRAGAEFKQNVIDYTMLLDRRDSASVEQDDLTDWLIKFQSEGDAALDYSLRRWAETSSPHWMIASLVKVNANHTQAGALIEAAARIRPDSPAFATAAYHHARLMIEAGRKDDARRKLDEILALKTPMPASARNRFLALRMSLARNAEEFFKFAQRAAAAVSFNEDGQELPVEAKDADDDSAIKSFLDGRVSFAEDSVRILNEAAPLAMLKDAALGTTAPSLPSHLREKLAVAAWTRAMLLGDDDAARELAPALLALVPEMKKQLDSYLAAKDGRERQDAMLYLILKFPGMRPYVDSGMGRLTAYAEIDSYRDNWWCDVKGRGYNRDAPSGLTKGTPQALGFLSAALQSAAAERRKLDALEIGPNDLCIRSVEWARRSPTDPRAPEALHLAVKATRYGCRDEQTLQRSKLAFDTLHKQYPNSVWAKQTKYYYGDQ